MVDESVVVAVIFLAVFFVAEEDEEAEAKILVRGGANENAVAKLMPLSIQELLAANERRQLKRRTQPVCFGVDSIIIGAVHWCWWVCMV